MYITIDDEEQISLRDFGYIDDDDLRELLIAILREKNDGKGE